MFKNRSLSVKVVKDPKDNPDPTILDQLNSMSPEELEELTDRLMKKAAIRIGGIIVAKVAATIIIAAITKKLLDTPK